MIDHSQVVAGDEVVIHQVEGPEDVEAFDRWVGDGRVMGVDVETTGLGMYGENFRARLCQFAGKDEAWVLRWEEQEAIQRGLDKAKLLVAHNLPYELQVFGVSGLEVDWTKCRDTRLMGHILDPRAIKDGGTGHSLDALAKKWLGVGAGDGKLVAEFEELCRGKGWASIKAKNVEDPARNPWAMVEDTEPIYVRYAGVDPILTLRLFYALVGRVAGFRDLLAWEHRVQRITVAMMMKGLATDGEYLEGLGERLEGEAQAANSRVVEEIDRRWMRPLTEQGQKAVLDWVAVGVGGYPATKRLKGKWKGRGEAKVWVDGELKWGRRPTTVGAYKEVGAGSNDVVAATLLDMGEKLVATSELTGKLSVDSAVLKPLMDMDKNGKRNGFREPNRLAIDVFVAKRSRKWKSTYVEAMLKGRDGAGVVHPSINSLQARTGRMAISGPPLQQLPSSDATIRDAFVARDGKVFVACDACQAEPRIMAEITDCPPLIEEASTEGADLYAAAAVAMYGEGWTAKERKLAKILVLGTAYGAGPRTISEQNGVSIEVVAPAYRAFKETFPEIKAWGQRQERMMWRTGRWEVIGAVSGRRMPVDEGRAYAALNYQIQGSARDLFAEAMVRVDDAGLGEFLVLPIHDELLFEVPEGLAEEVAREAERLMTCRFGRVIMAHEGEVVGPRWGDKYRGDGT